MNKKLLLVASVLVGMLFSGVAYVVWSRMQRQPAPVTQSTSSSVQPDAAPLTTSMPPATQSQPGVYKDYDAAAVATTKGLKILFFHAQWCPQCRQLDADIRAGRIPDNVTIFKIDFDHAQELRQKYGVTLQTTLVSIDDNGSMRKKYVAYDEPTLTALVREFQ